MPQVAHAAADEGQLPSPERATAAAWRGEAAALDALVDQAELRMEVRPKIMPPFRSSREWLWSRWNKEDSLIHATGKNIALSAVTTCVLLVLDRNIPQVHTLIRGAAEYWGYQVTISTLMLSFFLNQAYRYWRNMYDYCRRMQGRLNDVNMVLNTHLPRDPTTSKPLPEAVELAQRISRYGRVVGLLFMSGITEKFRPLSTQAGLKRLVSRNFLTSEEASLLESSQPGDWPYVLITWQMAALQEASRADGGTDKRGRPAPGILTGAPAGFHLALLDRLVDLRVTCASIEDGVAARMPVAYPQFVQVIIDCLLIATVPAMVDKFGSWWAVLGSAQLTLFYAGMLKLAKVFLDPFDNEDFKGKSLAVIETATLLSENHFLAERWASAVAEPLPWKREVAVEEKPDLQHALQLARRHPVSASLFSTPNEAWVVEGLSKGLEEQILSAGEVVYREGEAAYSMYLVASGVCLLSVNGQDIGCLGPGQSFGEVALLEAAPRSLTVTVQSESVVLLAISKAVFLDFVLPILGMNTILASSVPQQLSIPSPSSTCAEKLRAIALQTCEPCAPADATEHASLRRMVLAFYHASYPADERYPDLGQWTDAGFGESEGPLSAQPWYDAAESNHKRHCTFLFPEEAGPRPIRWADPGRVGRMVRTKRDM